LVVLSIAVVGAAGAGTRASAAAGALARSDAADALTDGDGDGGVDAASVVDVRADGRTSDAEPFAPPVAVAPKPTRTVQGRVFELGSRSPIFGAEVALDGAVVSSTGTDGRFEVAVSPGEHALGISASGYLPIVRPVRFEDPVSPLILRLRRRNGPDYETVVRADTSQAPLLTLDPREVRSVPGSLGDPFRAIETLPGVTTVAWPLPLYAIRGTNPGNTGYFLDDLRVPTLFHFALGPSLIHPYLIKSLDFYPGGYPARYGRYVGGTVSATTQGPPEDLAHVSIDARLFDVGALVSAPFDHGRGTVSLSGRYSYTAALVSLFNSDIDVSYSDAQLRVEHPLGAGRLVLLALGSTDALDSKSPTNVRDHVHMRFLRAAARYTRPVGPGRLGLSIGGGLDSSRAPFDENVLSNALGVTSRSTQDRLWYRAGLSPAVDVEVGLDGEAARYQPTLEQPNAAVGDLARPRTALLGAPYAALTLRLGRLTLIPAYRQDVYREGGTARSSPGPRLAGTLVLRRGLSLNGAVGHYSQLPSLPVQVSGFENFGLSQYGLQTAWQSSVGLDADLPFGVELVATTYLQRSVLSDVRDPNSGDYLLDDYLVHRQALSYGEEFLLRRPFGAHLYGWVSYTVSRSLRLFEGGNVGPSSWDQTHVANVVGSYRIGAWFLGARVHFNTGRPVTVATTYPVLTERLPAYFQLDLRAERQIVYDRFRMAFYVELLNATISRQITGLSQDYTEHESGYRIVVPSVGLRAEI
jgi:hypothetical protein